MADYHAFTVARTTEPDQTSLLAQLRSLDATVGIQHMPRTSDYVLKKSTAWTAPQITAAQNALETAPESTSQLTSQALADRMPIIERAIILALIDQLNVIRSKLSPALPAITTQQALDAIRTKAGTL